MADYKVEEVIELLVKNQEQLTGLVAGLKGVQTQARGARADVVSLGDAGAKLSSLGRGVAMVGMGITAAGAGSL